MTELLIIKTAEAEKIRNVLTKNQVDYQVVYNEIVKTKKYHKENLKNKSPKIIKIELTILMNEKMLPVNRIIKRGEVYHANLDDATGHEQKNDKDTERRSVVVVSNI